MATLSEENLQYILENVKFLKDRMEYMRHSMEHVENMLKICVERVEDED